MIADLYQELFFKIMIDYCLTEENIYKFKVRIDFYDKNHTGKIVHKKAADF